jgi:hypothetical protein
MGPEPSAARSLPRLPIVIDVAIAFIVLGAVIGFGKGFVVPLAAAGGALLTLGVLYAGPLTGALPTGTAGLGVGAIALFVGGTVFTTVGSFVVGIVHRVGILKRFDKVLGIPLGMATAVVTLYVAVVATLVLDGWLDPLHGKTALESQDIAALQTVAGANPAFATFADPQMLKLLAQSAAKAPVAAAELEKVDAAVAFYEQKLRPELLQSRIVPVLLAVGEKLPFMGRPATLPAP